MVRTIHKITTMALSASLVLSGALLPGNSAEAAKKLSISKTSISLKKGDSETLKIKNLKKGQTVKWKSSKPAVAKVTKAGKVTAKKAGAATITAKVAKQTFQCKVTVKKNKNSGNSTAAPSTESNDTLKIQKSDADINILETIIKQKTGRDAVNFGDDDYDAKEEYYEDADEDNEGELAFADLSSDCYKWDNNGRLSEIDYDSFEFLTGDLDLSGLTALTSLNIYNTGITSLNISSNKNLTYLNIEHTSISGLDISNNELLHTLKCRTSLVNELNVENNLLLDYGSFNKDTTFTGSNFDETTYNPEEQAALEELLGKLNGYGFKMLEDELDTYYQEKDTDSFYHSYYVSSLLFRWNTEGHLTAINLSGFGGFAEEVHNMEILLNAFPELQSFDWKTSSNSPASQASPIAKLDVSNNPKLKYLRCCPAAVKSLDLSHNPELKYIELSCGIIASDQDSFCLDVSGLEKLEYLGCGQFNIKELKLGNKPVLTDLICYQNKLSALDLSGCSSLVNIDCSGNDLTALDASSLDQLKTISCDEKVTVTGAGEDVFITH